MSNDGWPSGPRRYSISSPSSLLSSVDLLPKKRTVRSARGFLSVTTRANSAFRTSFALYVSVRFLSEYTLGDGGLVTLALFTIVGYCRLSSCYFGSPLFQGIFNMDCQHFQHQETIPQVTVRRPSSFARRLKPLGFYFRVRSPAYLFSLLWHYQPLMLSTLANFVGILVALALSTLANFVGILVALACLDTRLAAHLASISVALACLDTRLAAHLASISVGAPKRCHRCISGSG